MLCLELKANVHKNISRQIANKKGSIKDIENRYVYKVKL